jgi:hypothetical protein
MRKSHAHEHRRTSCLVVATVIVAVTTLAGIRPGAGATAGFGTFELIAAADGGRVVVSAPGAGPVDPISDGGSPSAQAVLNSLGTSAGYAAAPYPGESGVSGPGTVANLAGLPSPPPYPFIAQTSHPVAPDAEVSQPGYRLTSASRAATSESAAETGAAGPQGGALHGRSAAKVAQEAERLRAEAETVTESITVAGVLHIGRVASSASIVRPVSGPAEKHSSLTVEGVSVGGVAVGFDGSGLVLPGGAAPLPDGGPVAEALQRAGLRVERVAAVETDNGVLAAGLRITQVQAFPSGTTSTTTITFGQARAYSAADAVAIEPELPLPPGGVVVQEPPAAPGGVTGAPAPFTSPSGAAGRASVLPLTGTGAPGAGGFPPSSLTPTAPADAVAGAPPSGEGTALAAGPAASTIPDPRTSAGLLYLIVALGAVLAAAGGQLIRLLGERTE